LSGNSGIFEQSIGYSGISGKEILFYHNAEKKVLYFNKTTGAVADTTFLPNDAPNITNGWHVSFTNNQVFLWDRTNLKWKGYTIMSSNATPSITVADKAYTENDVASAIDSSATASDGDGDADWDTNAKLEVQITANNESSDEISIDTSGDFSISAGTLSYSGTAIGTIVESSGTENDGTVTNGDKYLQLIKL
jgi:hypothetical protein